MFTAKKYFVFINSFLGGVIYFTFKLCFFADDFVFNINKFYYFIVIVPILEEWIFRGNIQRILKDKLEKKDKGHRTLFFNTTDSFISVQNIITSVLFASIHLVYSPISHALMVFIPSLIFGLVYDRHQKLIFPVFLHGFYNLNVFII
ncbi:JDVT-CTERM system glutamic-type intramembrane protease MrtJ [Flexistipes sp.]|uniref:JDVT-CTERM system glutamic-type intramembrane protease MrtJ n=1 Tax=Flexistipes sp. TaxID=3088135 RepID=UPI002E1B23D5|nr:JDVT-CTERM system glutamic-type intramembrane protease [Flexistipes sp.]MEC9492917.1 JDVT-CTERM system glutamic-type intramembrane protease [Flexistipes sp.]